MILQDFPSQHKPVIEKYLNDQPTHVCGVYAAELNKLVTSQSTTGYTMSTAMKALATNRMNPSQSETNWPEVFAARLATTLTNAGGSRAPIRTE